MLRRSPDIRRSGSQRSPETYGPNGPEVVAVIDRLRDASPSEVGRLADSAHLIRGSGWDEAREVARDVTVIVGRGSMRQRAIDEGRLTCSLIGMTDGCTSVDAAIEAAIVHDLVGEYGYTKQHHRELTAPWRSVMGSWNGSTWLRSVA